jgi:hypothetical protein
MVELKRREKKSNSEEHLQVSFDHIWPGSEARYCARTDQEHPDRGERCSRALGSLLPFRSTRRRRSSRRFLSSVMTRNQNLAPSEVSIKGPGCPWFLPA